MGIISLEHIDNLFWLGRYSERVYTTLRLYFRNFDSMIELGEVYKDFCEKLDIPDVYGSAEVFKEKYPFNPEDANSIISSLTRAYDNGIIMRELIGSEALSYVQIALYEMQKASKSNSPLVDLQEVIDHILAFWGVADDSIDDDQTRDVIKAGKRIERIDLYARLGMSGKEILRELKRLRPRVANSGMRYHAEYLDEIEELAKEASIDYYRIVYLIESLIIMG